MVGKAWVQDYYIMCSFCCIACVYHLVLVICETMNFVLVI